MIFYENKKTSEVFMIRDPELRLDELAQMQDEVAMLLGFGGPAAEAAKVAGMKFTPDGKLEKADAPQAPPTTENVEEPAAAEIPADTPAEEPSTDAAASEEDTETPEGSAKA